MPVNMNTFWSDLGVVGGVSGATNQYDLYNGLIFDDGFVSSSQYDFFNHLGTNSYEFFKSYNSVDPNIVDQYTFFQNTSDPNIVDQYTFYTYAGQYLSGGTPTPEPISALGGTITTITADTKVYKVHTFLSGGTFDVTSLGTTSGQVEYLLVGGGGGGGNPHGGGGGAGGFVTGNTNISVSAYTISVGDGGAGGASGGFTRGNTGDDTVFFGITAYGGGGGGAGFNNCVSDPDVTNGIDGASGGGGGGADPGDGGIQLYDQGNNGGSGDGCPENGRGGGGAGQVGADNNFDETYGPKGGDGLQSAINGTLTYYAGGGGGGVWCEIRTLGGPGGLGGGGNGGNCGNNPGLPGTSNTGGGGGGGSDFNPGGGNGGSGIIIIRYEIF